MKPRVTVILADTTSWNQPIVRNLLASLVQRFDLQLVGFQSEFKNNVAPEGVEIVLFDDLNVGSIYQKVMRRCISRMARLLRRIVPQVHLSGALPLLMELAKTVKRLKPKTVIAIDFSALFVARRAGFQSHFICLEILQNDAFYLNTSSKQLLSVLVNNRLRYLQLFPEKALPVFEVPNFPVYRSITTPLRKHGLVLAGCAFPGFGMRALLEFLRANPGEKLTVKGFIPPNFVQETKSVYPEIYVREQLDVNHTFQEETEYINSLAEFEIGFSFYDLDLAGNDFFGKDRPILPWSVSNYLTGAPGKIGYYALAGIPFISLALPGTMFLHRYNAGVLINDLGVTTIKNACDDIRQNYARYAQGCVQMAQDFCFQKNIEPYLDFLASSVGPIGDVTRAERTMPHTNSSL
jgi:hypothetical protein